MASGILDLLFPPSSVVREPVSLCWDTPSSAFLQSRKLTAMHLFKTFCPAVLITVSACSLPWSTGSTADTRSIF